MEEKELKINIPEGYEIDKEQSTFERIVFKKEEKKIKTWDDLHGMDMPKKSVYISDTSELKLYNSYFNQNNKNIFINERHAKSALAMAQISQLMPFYGNMITDEEWGDVNKSKYVIERYSSEIACDEYSSIYCFLAFHTEEQREEFIKYNEQLVKDYLMIK